MADRLHFSGDFAKRMRIVATIIGLVLSLTLPGTYFMMGWHSFNRAGQAEVKELAWNAAASVTDNPTLWFYSVAKFIGPVDSATVARGLASIRAYDNNFNLIYIQSIDKDARLTFPFQSAVRYNNEVVGYVEIWVSAWPLVFDSMALAVLCAVLGISMVSVLYRYSVRLVTSAEQGVLSHAEQARRQAETEVERLDRLSLVGQMAAGIGHEVRNPLTTVRGYLQLFSRKKEFSPLAAQFQLMMEELDRANGIITEFLSLAHNKAVTKKNCSLNQMVEALQPLINSDALLRGQWVEVSLEDIPDIWADEKEIRQLMLNITRNGLEAMSPGGCLTIRTAVDGDDVLLSVSDQGPGMDAGLIARLGTPFVTTKATGTGLGLAVCYSIAHRHSAKIGFVSGKDGTTCTIRFPALPAEKTATEGTKST